MPKASGLVGSLELSCANTDNLTFLSGFLPEHIPLERSARLRRSLPHGKRVQPSASPIGGRHSQDLLPPEAASAACLRFFSSYLECPHPPPPVYTCLESACPSVLNLSSNFSEKLFRPRSHWLLIWILFCQQKKIFCQDPCIQHLKCLSENASV